MWFQTINRALNSFLSRAIIDKCFMNPFFESMSWLIFCWKPVSSLHKGNWRAKVKVVLRNRVNKARFKFAWQKYKCFITKCCPFELISLFRLYESKVRSFLRFNIDTYYIGILFPSSVRPPVRVISSNIDSLSNLTIL